MVPVWMPAFGHGMNPTDVADLTAFLASIAPRPKDSIAEVKMALHVASPKGMTTGCEIFRARTQVADELGL